jgi:hypothetical protein
MTFFNFLIRIHQFWCCFQDFSAASLAGAPEPSFIGTVFQARDLLGLANECRERLVELPGLLVEQQVTGIFERVEAGARDLRRYASAHLDSFLVNV